MRPFSTWLVHSLNLRLLRSRIWINFVAAQASCQIIVVIRSKTKSIIFRFFVIWNLRQWFIDFLIDLRNYQCFFLFFFPLSWCKVYKFVAHQYASSEEAEVLARLSPYYRGFPKVCVSVPVFCSRREVTHVFLSYRCGAFVLSSKEPSMDN